MLHIQIPCTYENETLRINALNLEGQGWPKEDALFNAIKSGKNLTEHLLLAQLKEVYSVRKDGALIIEVPYSDTLWKAIMKNEPLPKDAAKKKSFIEEPTAEETILMGF